MALLLRRATRLMMSLLGVEFLLLLTVFIGVTHVQQSDDALTSNSLLDAVTFACITMLTIFAIGAYQGDALRSAKVLVPRLLTGAVIGTFAMYLGWIVPVYGAILPWQPPTPLPTAPRRQPARIDAILGDALARHNQLQAEIVTMAGGDPCNPGRMRHYSELSQAERAVEFPYARRLASARPCCGPAKSGSRR